MAITVTCGSCRKKMVARDSLAGTYVKCSGCGKPALVGQAPDDSPASPALQPAAEFSVDERMLEQLKVIRLYLGWLLVIAAVPAACTAALLVLWLAARAASAGG